MKKFLFAIIAVLLLLIPSFTAYADVLIEPEDNFYRKHSNQIISMDRSFRANGADGFVSVMKAPDSNREIAKIPNGEDDFIKFSCLYDGEYWGYSFWRSGWVKLDQLLVLYDHITFSEEHINDFYVYSGDYAELTEAGSAIAWPWPGAEEPTWTFESVDTTYFNIDTAYMDAQGREWGFVGYLYGSRNFWMCLSDPLNHDIPAFNPAPEPKPWAPSLDPQPWQVYTNIESSASSHLLTIIIISVFVLAFGTAALIWVLWKSGKNKRKTG